MIPDYFECLLPHSKSCIPPFCLIVVFEDLEYSKGIVLKQLQEAPTTESYLPSMFDQNTARKDWYESPVRCHSCKEILEYAHEHLHLCAQYLRS